MKVWLFVVFVGLMLVHVVQLELIRDLQKRVAKIEAVKVGR